MTTGIDLLAVITCVRHLPPSCVGSTKSWPYSLCSLGTAPQIVSQCGPNLFVIRLAFVTLRNNLMVLSLRAMFVQFVVLMLIAMFCFAGFLYALWT